MTDEHLESEEMLEKIAKAANSSEGNNNDTNSMEKDSTSKIIEEESTSKTIEEEFTSKTIEEESTSNSKENDSSSKMLERNSTSQTLEEKSTPNSKEKDSTSKTIEETSNNTRNQGVRIRNQLSYVDFMEISFKEVIRNHKPRTKIIFSSIISCILQYLTNFIVENWTWFVWCCV